VHYLFCFIGKRCVKESSFYTVSDVIISAKLPRKLVLYNFAAALQAETHLR